MSVSHAHFSTYRVHVRFKKTHVCCRKIFYHDARHYATIKLYFFVYIYHLVRYKNSVLSYDSTPSFFCILHRKINSCSCKSRICNNFTPVKVCQLFYKFSFGRCFNPSCFYRCLFIFFVKLLYI